ncbi:GNAT family N-acetyltransferase [Allopusillimonas soli]|uniref:GNAT family N-acetyltransferase n=1 Tax=Allopusillimonas soli TaxID=659016 RepID=UPI00352D1612
MDLAIEVRPATRADAQQIYAFIHELAEYEKAAHEVVASADDVVRTLFEGRGPAKALICERAGQAIGFAVYFFSYSTWLGRSGIYLEDLYVTPAARGCGAGKMLLRHIARIAMQEGCGRFEWSVLDWNEPAIRFYQSLGAKPQDEWIRYRLAGDALRDFAQDNG